MNIMHHEYYASMNIQLVDRWWLASPEAKGGGCCLDGRA